MTRPVFFGEHPTAAITDPGLSTLQEGDRFTWQGSEVHHAIVVQRHCVGDRIDLIDGSGLRLEAEIIEITDQTKTRACVHMQAVNVQVEHPYCPRIVLVQALAKGRRDEQAVEAAIEIGADEIIPWSAQFCQVQWKGAKAAKGKAKWDHLADAATKQSRRSHRPVIHDLMNTPTLVNAIESSIDSDDTVLVLSEEASLSYSTILANYQLHNASPSTPLADVADMHKIWIIVGPEGGISPDEIRDLRSAGAQVVRLGKEIMRSSTAGPAAIAALVYVLRRWDA